MAMKAQESHNTDGETDNPSVQIENEDFVQEVTGDV